MNPFIDVVNPYLLSFDSIHYAYIYSRRLFEPLPALPKTSAQRVQGHCIDIVATSCRHLCWHCRHRVDFVSTLCQLCANFVPTLCGNLFDSHFLPYNIVPNNSPGRSVLTALALKGGPRGTAAPPIVGGGRAGPMFKPPAFFYRRCSLFLRVISGYKGILTWVISPISPVISRVTLLTRS